MRESEMMFKLRLPSTGKDNNPWIFPNSHNTSYTTHARTTLWVILLRFYHICLVKQSLCYSIFAFVVAHQPQHKTALHLAGTGDVRVWWSHLLPAHEERKPRS